MASRTLFKSMVGRLLPRTDAVNEEGAAAYALPPKQALAQYAVTGCLNGTFYATDAAQLDRVLALCEAVDPDFVAQTAVYARRAGHMKDMPALLLAWLAAHDVEACARAFPGVVDNTKMLRNFVQIVRSGATGRKSFGTAPKRLVRNWLAGQSDEALFRGSVGGAPSLADIVKMVHPKPGTAQRSALFGWLLRRPHDVGALPEVVQAYEDFKAGRTAEVPDVPFQMLTSLQIGTKGWKAIARHASWQATRMNLNTFARHGVFEDASLTHLVAERLREPSAVRRARAFPYQLLAAWAAAGAGVPGEVREALQDAMEIAIANVPEVAGGVYVCPDVSASMGAPVTGWRQGATTAVRCVDVAALVAAAMVRRNPRAEVIPFEHRVVPVRLNPRDSVMTNAALLASIGGGGTSTSAPLAHLNRHGARGDLVVLVSDQESWIDARGRRGTETMREWNVFKKRNPAARLVCIDLQPYRTVQAVDREDVLNVGGFSDQVFEVLADFARGDMAPGHFAERIAAFEI